MTNPTATVGIAPANWDDARDAAFFRITAPLFDGAFCAGATVLLASYDDTAISPHQRELPTSVTTAGDRSTASGQREDSGRAEGAEHAPDEHRRTVWTTQEPT